MSRLRVGVGRVHVKCSLALALLFGGLLMPDGISTLPMAIKLGVNTSTEAAAADKTDGVDMPLNGTEPTVNASSAAASVQDDFDLSKFMQAQERVAMRGLELEPERKTTLAPVGYTVVKWALLGVIVLIPLILLPTLFLFGRRGGGADEAQGLLQRQQPFDDMGQENGQQVMHVTATALPRPMALRPTTDRDPYLEDQSAAASVRNVDQTGKPLYWLTPDDTVTWAETGQLYHLATGLLFNPIPVYSFNPDVRSIAVHQPNGSSLYVEPNSNLVYDPESNLVYERCLALTWQEQADTEGGEWKLPRSPAPATDSEQSRCTPIRRARPDELPARYRHNYATLLGQWQHSQLIQQQGLLDKKQQQEKAMQADNNEPQQPEKPQPSQSASPMLSVVSENDADQPKMSEVENSSDGVKAGKPLPNRLVLTNRDFSRLAAEDLANTPRGSSLQPSQVAEPKPEGGNAAPADLGDSVASVAAPAVHDDKATTFFDARSQVSFLL